MAEQEEQELLFTSTPYVFNYGKYEGEEITDVPNDYLQWSVDNIEREDIVAYCEEELARRNRTGEYIDDDYDKPWDSDDGYGGEY
jgi:hypothetical protein